jgi:lipopolysaccharide export system protein LptA
MKCLIPQNAFAPGLAAAALAAAAWAGPAAAQQLATNSKAPIDVVADNLETSNSGCTYTWTGNAEALQDNARIRADKLVIINQVGKAKAGKASSSSGGAGNCGDMDRMEAHGNVYYVRPGQRVRANDAVYEAGSTVITMTGDVVAVRDQNVLRGDKMVFNTDTGQGQVVGTSKGRGAKDRPRGVFYPKSSDDSSSNSGKPK